jgi:hypothetical protein
MFDEEETNPWDSPAQSDSGNDPSSDKSSVSSLGLSVQPKKGPAFEEDARYLRIGACVFALLVATIPSWVATSVADTNSSAHLFEIPLFGPFTLAAMVASLLAAIFADKVAGVNTSFVAFVNLLTAALCLVAIAISDLGGTTRALSFAKLFGKGPPATMAVTVWVWVCLVLCLVAGFARPLVASGGADGEYRERYLISSVFAFVATLLLIWARYVPIASVTGGGGRVGISAAEAPFVAPATSALVLAALLSLLIGFVSGWLSFWIPAALGLVALGLSMSATSIGTFVSAGAYREFLSIDNAPDWAVVSISAGPGWIIGALGGFLLLAACTSLALVPERPKPQRASAKSGRPDTSVPTPPIADDPWAVGGQPAGEAAATDVTPAEPAPPTDPWSVPPSDAADPWSSDGGVDEWGSSSGSGSVW